MADETATDASGSRRLCQKRLHGQYAGRSEPATLRTLSVGPWPRHADRRSRLCNHDDDREPAGGTVRSFGDAIGRLRADRPGPRAARLAARAAQALALWVSSTPFLKFSSVIFSTAIAASRLSITASNSIENFSIAYLCALAISI